ncbi:MAG TPA: lipid-A-disaccharide synthase [Cycloclasticus sp.]|jgi:lipid-A-disaccharide synthase|nr:lipid-A-disaccharide synthase [Cycloclasticus sp.]HIL92525.1 lipid-A-disaccharide synthase [Cycloclasticus sp.]
MNKPLKIMMVAGEHSGDILAAGLIKRLKERYPDAQFSGIGGARMIKEGFHSYYPMSKLSVFGLFEVLKHLPELLAIRRTLQQTILNESPDVFVGIDAPDFNLKLEKELHNRDIKTVHYVSPTVWAWRPKRIKKLIGSLNALLCIFPFEEDYFKNTAVPAYFIGHPLADQYKQHDSTSVAKKALDIGADTPVLTMMPGSRMGELNRHSLIFLETAEKCAKKIPNLKVLVPLADESSIGLFNDIYKESGIQLDLIIKQSATASMIAASDMVLVASGTATLEVMLLKKPMVVAYKVSALTAWVFRTFNLLKAPFVSMPNLIAGRELIKEFIQEQVRPDVLAEELLRIYHESGVSDSMVEHFDDMAISLCRDADLQAADIVSRVLNGDIA